MRGTLRIKGQTATPRSVTMPVLAVVDPESDLVPPNSVRPFLDALPNRNWTLMHYEADTGVALRHVGVLAGRNAHRILWPEILLDSHESRLCSLITKLSLDPIFVLWTALSEFVSQHPAAVVHNYLKSSGQRTLVRGLWPFPYL
jgi:hypothetical protein